jgi:3-(3-hydroxy-phenyl)propionate hydroxylase
VDPRVATGATRLRALARRGPLALDADRVAQLDPGGTLAAALGLRAGEVWILRPDAHIAAIVDATRPEEVRAAGRRAEGRPA